jgi:hypothetical protein
MTVGKRELFELFEPPPGSVERMARRIERRHERPAGTPRRWLAAAALGIIAAASAAFLILRASDEPPAAQRGANLYAARQFDRLLGRRLESVELSVAIDDRSPVIVEVESSRPNVRLYDVQPSEP